MGQVGLKLEMGVDTHVTLSATHPSHLYQDEGSPPPPPLPLTCVYIGTELVELASHGHSHIRMRTTQENIIYELPHIRKRIEGIDKTVSQLQTSHQQLKRITCYCGILEMGVARVKGQSGWCGFTYLC